MVQEVHHNDLTAALAAPVAVLDFNATWCGPCKMLGPVLEEVSNEMADKAAFFGIDCDENPQLAAQFGVSSIPCLVVLKNGILPLGVPFGAPKGTEKAPPLPIARVWRLPAADSSAVTKAFGSPRGELPRNG